MTRRDLTLDGGFNRLSSPAGSSITGVFLTGGVVLQNVHLEHLGAGASFPSEAFMNLVNPATAISSSQKGILVDHVLVDNCDGVGDALIVQANNTAELPSGSYAYCQGTVSNCVVDMGSSATQGIGVGGFVNVVNNYVTSSNSTSTATLYFFDSGIQDGGYFAGNRGVLTGSTGIGVYIHAHGSGNKWQRGHVVHNTIIGNGNTNVIGYHFGGENFSNNVVSGNTFVNLGSGTMTNCWGMIAGDSDGLGAGNVFYGNILDANVTSGGQLSTVTASANSSFFNNIGLDGTSIVPAHGMTIDGSFLVGMNASNLASGTVALARLPSDLALIDASNTFIFPQTFYSTTTRKSITVGSASGTDYDIGRDNADGLLYFQGHQSGFTGYVFLDAAGNPLLKALSGGIVTPTHTPSSSTDTGVTGQIAWDASYIYVCTATNTWKRVAISSW